MEKIKSDMTDTINAKYGKPFIISFTIVFFFKIAYAKFNKIPITTNARQKIRPVFVAGALFPYPMVVASKGIDKCAILRDIFPNLQNKNVRKRSPG